MLCAMRTTVIAALGVAAALTSAPAAVACPSKHFQFLSPTGNIACTMDAGYAVCKVREHDWPVPATGHCAQASVPGTVGMPGADLQLGEGDKACLGSNLGQIFFDGQYAPAALGYGQTHTVGALRCASEPAGVRCTDAGTGHFFLVSRQTYELG